MSTWARVWMPSMYVPMVLPVRPSVATMDATSPTSSKSLGLSGWECDEVGGGMRVDAARTATAPARRCRAGRRKPRAARVQAVAIAAGSL